MNFLPDISDCFRREKVIFHKTILWKLWNKIIYKIVVHFKYPPHQKKKLCNYSLSFYWIYLALFFFVTNLKKKNEYIFLASNFPLSILEVLVNILLADLIRLMKEKHQTQFSNHSTDVHPDIGMIWYTLCIYLLQYNFIPEKNEEKTTIWVTLKRNGLISDLLMSLNVQVLWRLSMQKIKSAWWVQIQTETLVSVCIQAVYK